jgi:hypothetical protein
MKLKHRARPKGLATPSPSILSSPSFTTPASRMSSASSSSVKTTSADVSPFMLIDSKFESPPPEVKVSNDDVVCSVCNEDIVDDEDDNQIVFCDGCGMQ